VTVEQLHQCLRPVLPTDVLLISDGAVSYRRFATQAGITHKAVNVQAGERVRGAIHIQNVNSWHSRIQKLARQVPWGGQPLPGPLLRMAAVIGCAQADDARPSFACRSSARLSG